jgi:hypothetical protein
VISDSKAYRLHPNADDEGHSSAFG